MCEELLRENDRRLQAVESPYDPLKGDAEDPTRFQICSLYTTGICRAILYWLFLRKGKIRLMFISFTINLPPVCCFIHLLHVCAWKTFYAFQVWCVKTCLGDCVIASNRIVQWNFDKLSRRFREDPAYRFTLPQLWRRLCMCLREDTPRPRWS